MNFTFAHMFASIIVASVSQSTEQLIICGFWPPWNEDLYVLSHQKFFRGNITYFPPLISSLEQLTLINQLVASR